MNALISLACAFPPDSGLHGACTTIADLCSGDLALADRLFVPSKQAAVHLIIAANMERMTSDGNGNRAAKRAACVEKAALDGRLESPGLSFAQHTRRLQLHRQVHLADEVAEQRSEGRRAAYHDLPIAVNFHE